MNKEPRKFKKCDDCKGLGFIVSEATKNRISCIICNETGTTNPGPQSQTTEAEKVYLYKVAMDYINGKKNGWYN
tara:strand:+ start:980 stop:1201 length:222 start_codon:yes stop_codon:yes gene_type:complete